jgi:pyruvate formate lyase activating enzyme
MEHPAILWDKLDAGRVRCRVCRRRCVIAPGQRGFCLTRENRDGALLALTYGSVAALHVAPIEAKPLYHFHPGTSWLSLGSLGCNCRCPGCQNWEIAHATPADGGPDLRQLRPDEAVALALESGCKGLSWTYNEPTMWIEYALETSRLARQKGLLAHYVTNGYITAEALDTIAPYLDAWRVDIKAFDRDTYRRLANLADFEGILESAVRARTTHRLHVECVTNLVPGLNDAPAQLTALADWIVRSLGPDTPWHVTRFVPHLDLSHVPATPVATLESAHQIGRDRGLRYVYIGNVPGHKAEHTYCHACGALLIERRGHGVVSNHLLGDFCPFCGARIPGVWGEAQG